MSPKKSQAEQEQLILNAAELCRTSALVIAESRRIIATLKKNLAAHRLARALSSAARQVRQSQTSPNPD
jgi:hypothetical protein